MHKKHHKMLGEQVRTARSYMGISQADLAKKTKTAQSAISRAEKTGCGITLAQTLIEATGAELRFHHVSIVLPNGTRVTNFYG